MARTLADMTPEERQACVGRWCDNLVSTAKEPAPVVLECVQGDLCWVLHIDMHGERSCFSLGGVSPRFDLPRAWNPDGTPVECDWQYAYYTPGISRGFYTAVTEVGPELPEGTQVARRQVGEWEPTDE